jgi:hypothetical protein
MDQSKAKRNFHTLSNLQNAQDTFRERNKCYGDNYKTTYGNVMVALFPNGLKLETKDDWNRFGALHMIVAKLTRYVVDPHHGHHDSVHDMGVYSFILEELDAAIAGLDTTRPEELFERINQ